MLKNTVVIKVSYDKNAQHAKVKAPEMVTVWHVRRILLALTILILLVWLLFNVFKTNDIEVLPSEPQPVVNVPAPMVETVTNELKPPVQEALQSLESVSGSSKSSEAIGGERVIKAVLVSKFVNDQPAEAISRLKVSKTQVIELFYFSEVKQLKNKSLSHVWFKNGQLVHKKHWPEVKHSVAKLISNYRFSAKDEGEWQVVLQDKKGNHLSETQFFVASE